MFLSLLYSQYFEYTSQRDLRHNIGKQLCLRSKMGPVELGDCHYTGKHSRVPENEEWELTAVSEYLKFSGTCYSFTFLISEHMSGPITIFAALLSLLFLFSQSSCYSYGSDLAKIVHGHLPFYNFSLLTANTCRMLNCYFGNACWELELNGTPSCLIKSHSGNKKPVSVNVCLMGIILGVVGALRPSHFRGKMVSESKGMTAK